MFVAGGWFLSVAAGLLSSAASVIVVVGMMSLVRIDGRWFVLLGCVGIVSWLLMILRNIVSVGIGIRWLRR